MDITTLNYFNACKCLNVDFLEKHLNNIRKNPNIKNSTGDTLLHVVCYVTNERTSIDMLELLLRISELDLNAQNVHGNTPLHIACLKINCFEVAKMLLDNKTICKDTKNKFGQTPLDIALSLKNQYVIDLLRK